MTTSRYLPILALVVLTAGCSGQDGTPTGPQYASAAVETRTLAVGVEAAGVIEPIRTVEVKSKASGEILELRVDTGDLVKQGELIVRIDPRTPANRVAQTDAELNAARARLTRAKAQLDRAKKLLEQNWINKADYDQYVLDVANADSQVVAARVALENARIALEDTEIRAPIAGTVISKKVERGQVISSPTQDVGGGTLLLTMANLDQVRVRGRVDETDVGKLREGMPASVTVAAFPGHPFTGTITRIEPLAVVEQNVTLFSVLVGLENKEGLLKPGMNVEIKIDVASRPDVLTLPVMALRTDRDLASTAQILGLDEAELRRQLTPAAAAANGNGAAAPAGKPTRGDRPSAGQAAFQFSGNFWVVKDVNGQYVPTPIKAGLTDLDRIEVTAGLVEGDKVLLLPSTSLMEAQQQLQNFINRRFGSALPGMGQRSNGQTGSAAGGAAGGQGGSGANRQGSGAGGTGGGATGNRGGGSRP